MNMKIGRKIFVKVVKSDYSEVLAKPACERSRIFCCIAKQDFLDPRLMKYIQKLGYEIVSVIPKEMSNDSLPTTA